MECFDPTTRVYYPRHEEYTGRGYCTRCGETTNTRRHARHRAVAAAQQEEDARQRDWDEAFMDGRID